MTIINTTPHPIIFKTKDGTEFDLPPSKWIINASIEDQVVTVRNGVEYVRTRFVPSAEGMNAIKEIRSQYGPDAIIVGSMIAAQAYPGDVVAMTPAPGFERVPVDQKRMNPHKFTIFGDLPPVATPQTDSAPADPVEAARREVAEAEAAVQAARAVLSEASAHKSALDASMRGKPRTDDDWAVINAAYEEKETARRVFFDAKARLEKAQFNLVKAERAANPDMLVEVGAAAGASPKSKNVVFYAPASISDAVMRGESVSVGYEIKRTPAGHTHVILTPASAKPDRVVKLVKAQGGVELPDDIKQVAGFASNHGQSCILIEGPKGAAYVACGYKGRQRWDRTL